ncbi:MAG: NUDIX domain-containing protein, partial [Proteobacteria bacterium]|nr:NUDIX domain-containing protein [Pseudomonadota bacterium]
PTASQVLLLKHRKLNKWLQLGGHCDGNPETAQVAMREAQEESGSHHLTLINWQPDLPSIFVSDLDIHTIPNSPNKPSHFHFDVRYFAICALPHQLKREKREATDLRWFDWTAAEHITQEQSLHRPFKKFVMLATLFPQALSTIGKTA